MFNVPAVLQNILSVWQLAPASRQ